MRPPARFAAGLVTVSLRALPPGELRRRYQQELLAELFVMPRARQLRYAVGVASTAWSLRTATAGYQPMEAPMAVVTPKKPLQCRLGMHRWQTTSTEDGGTYRACSRCGKYSDPPVRLPLGA